MLLDKAQIPWRICIIPDEEPEITVETNETNITSTDSSVLSQSMTQNQTGILNSTISNTSSSEITNKTSQINTTDTQFVYPTPTPDVTPTITPDIPQNYFSEATPNPTNGQKANETSELTNTTIPTETCNYTISIDDEEGFIFLEGKKVGHIYSFAGSGSGNLTCSLYNGSISCVSTSGAFYTGRYNGPFIVKEIKAYIQDKKVTGESSASMKCPDPSINTKNHTLCKGSSFVQDIPVTDNCPLTGSGRMIGLGGEGKKGCVNKALFKGAGTTFYVPLNYIIGRDSFYNHEFSMLCTVKNAYKQIDLWDIPDDYRPRLKGELDCKGDKHFSFYILDDNLWEYGSHARLTMGMPDNNTLRIKVNFSDSPCNFHNNNFWCYGQFLSYGSRDQNLSSDIGRDEIWLYQLNYGFENAESKIPRARYKLRYVNGGVPKYTKFCQTFLGNNGGYIDGFRDFYPKDTEWSSDCRFHGKLDCVGTENGFMCKLFGFSAPILYGDGPAYVPVGYHFIGRARGHVNSGYFVGSDPAITNMCGKYECSDSKQLNVFDMDSTFLFEGKCPTPTPDPDQTPIT